MTSRPYVSGAGQTGAKRKRGLLRLRNFVILGLLLLVAGVTWRLMTKDAQNGPNGRNFANMPVSVALAPVRATDIHVRLAELGTVTPLNTVAVKTQIAGRLTSVNFTEGQIVKKGDLLALVDPRPYQYALETAQGTLKRDQALLKNAKLDLERYRVLVQQDSIPGQQLDTQRSLVEQLSGTVRSDEAAVSNAQLNFDYCHIVVPVAGRVGLRFVDPGNYVSAGDTTNIAVVTQIQPISVIFTIPEDALPQVAKRFNGGAVLPVTARDRAQSSVLGKGKLATIDNEIDPTTGTVKLRAMFGNEDGILFPNQFVNVELEVDILKDTLAIPNAALLHGAPGAFVYIAKDDGTVSVRPVTAGPVDGDLVAITNGLSAGEQVVTDGTDRLKEGAKIMLREGQQPAPAKDGEQPQRRRQKSSG